MTITVRPTVIYDGTPETLPKAGRRYVYVIQYVNNPHSGELAVSEVRVATSHFPDDGFAKPGAFVWAYVEVKA